jgi:heme-degrading monooxygenase HmoA
MIAVLFEVWPQSGKAETYFEMAAALKADLEQIDGFISVERFESVTQPGKYLSMSFWRNEDAIENWYCHDDHSSAQRNGIDFVFDDYQIRVANVFRDYDMAKGRPKNVI